MLHIILMILKIIGIVILSLLGLILLLILSVLFVPIRYKTEASYYGSFKMHMKIGWFLNALRVNISYDKEFQFDIKALFFTLYKNTGSEEEKESHKQYGKELYNDVASFAKEKYINPDISATEPELKSQSVEESSDIAKERLKSEKDKRIEYEKSVEKEKDKTLEQDNIPSDSEEKDTTNHKKSDIKSKLKSIKVKWCNIKNKFLDMINTIKGVANNIKSAKDKMSSKLNRLKKTIKDERNRQLVRFLYEQFKILLDEIKPVKYNINIHFGCEDAYDTGRVLMYASILYGLLGIEMNITPDFDKSVKEGDIFMRGRIRIYKLLLITFRVYNNKRFKEVVLDR